MHEYVFLVKVCKNHSAPTPANTAHARANAVDGNLNSVHFAVKASLS